MENTLLLHIGMPKTGTTALQGFLFFNRSKLEKYGWCYPIMNEGEIGYWERWEAERCGNGHGIYDALLVNDAQNEWDKGIEIILKHLKDKNVILSTEDIYENWTGKFIASMKEKFENIKVVIYLRRQDRAIESRYNQWVKGSIIYKPFKEYIESEPLPDNYLDYKEKLDTISQIIGRENLIVRVYEKQQLTENDTIKDFLSILGIPSDQDDWEKGHAGNGSLQGNYLEIKRLLNSVLYVDGLMGNEDSLHEWSYWKVKTDLANVCTELSESFSQEKGETGLFTVDERKEFLQKFASGNEEIARKYLHREEGILFYDDRMDFPVIEMNQHSSFESDMIRVFAAMMYAQSYRFRRLLEKKSDEIIGKIMIKEALRKSKNRKLLLFGAGRNCRKLLKVAGDMPTILIADNDLTKQGMVLNGIQVSHAGDIADWKKYFVVVTCQETDEIEEQLHGFCLEKEEDYILMREYVL